MRTEKKRKARRHGEVEYLQQRKLALWQSLPGLSRSTFPIAAIVLSQSYFYTYRYPPLKNNTVGWSLFESYMLCRFLFLSVACCLGIFNRLIVGCFCVRNLPASLFLAQLLLALHDSDDGSSRLIPSFWNRSISSISTLPFRGRNDVRYLIRSLRFRFAVDIVSTRTCSEW